MKHALSTSLFSLLSHDEDKTSVRSTIYEEDKTVIRNNVHDEDNATVQTGTELPVPETCDAADATILTRTKLLSHTSSPSTFTVRQSSCAEESYEENTTDNVDIQQFCQYFDSLLHQFTKIIFDKESVLRLVITALITGGHILLEDEPGTGKTMLAKSIAQCICLSFRRIQCTPDMLPSDITGVPWYNQHSGKFEFKKGPIFSSLVLIDEINRASAKTQSALLEVMEEHQITLDGISYNVPKPFIVIATQNTNDQLGTFRLPEAQLDRFFMRLSLGVPREETSVQILQQLSSAKTPATASAVLDSQTLQYMRDTAQKVHIDTALLSYITALVYHIRASAYVSRGPSIRSAIALVQASRVWAASQGRDYVIPADISHLLEPIVAHRITLSIQAQHDEHTCSSIIEQTLRAVPVPEMAMTPLHA